MNWKLSLIGASALVFIAASARAQGNGDIIDICSNAETHVLWLCPATCAQIACGDQGFLVKNVSFCYANFFDEKSRANAKDSAECTSIFGEKPVEVPQPVPTPTPEPVAEGQDCLQLNDIFQQKECELAQHAPSCSPTVVELEERSAQLVTTMKTEIAKYGELLTRKYGDVGEREALCAFSRAELSDSFKLASENPPVLESLQRQAQDIQNCQTSWEDALRNYKVEGTADSLVNTLVNESEGKLEGLKVGIKILTTSVDKLKNAAKTIQGIIGLYLTFCDG